jgi:Protein of unknown function (DUF3108)
MRSPFAALIVFALPLFGASETLRYNVNWPSGLSLGEATLSADNLDASAASRKLEFRLEASIPGFAVVDEVTSLTEPGYCSLRLTKKLKHGPRITHEVSEFKGSEGHIERKTEKGGSAKIPFNGCGHDALAMIYFLRNELRQGRIPSVSTVYFGSAYQVTFKYAGAVNAQLGSGSEPADKVEMTIQGPASKNQAEIWFGRDPMRTPLILRVPLLLGTFAMELQR